ncbi:MAG: PIG-L deacetylase family protein [Acidimicrobiales bacterium]
MRPPRALVRAVARAKPAVPESAWPALLALRSLAGAGPVVGLPGWRRVLVLAAHPDDESVGAGGTLALLADSGASVTAVFATDGEATRGSKRASGATAALRRAEAAAACRVLGVADVRHLGLADGGLGASVDVLASAISAVSAELEPEAVMLPWWLDDHPDHQALSVALRAAEAPDSLEVWGYETWTPLPANRIVDISAVLDRKRRALAAHATAHLAFDVSASVGLARWRSIYGLMGKGHAEAFLAAPVGGYLELMTRFAVQ